VQHSQRASCQEERAALKERLFWKGENGVQRRVLFREECGIQKYCWYLLTKKNGLKRKIWGEECS